MDFNLHMLESITNNFSADHKVGGGGFGDVYKAVYAGQEIAVKRLHPLQGLDDKEFDNEFRNLSKVHHENVVKLIGYCYESRRKFFEHDGNVILATEMERIFCFEYMPGGNLEKHITADSCDLDWPTCYKIIKGICEGLNHLHTAYQKPILHLDIKPANILLDKNMNAKIADLGLSRLAIQPLVIKNVKGTPGYRPPEFRRSGFISSKNDVFSLGVLILQLLDGNIGLIRSTEMAPDQFIQHVYGNWKRRLNERPGYPSHEIECLQVRKCAEIALRCAVHDRHKRPSTKDVVDELRQLEAEIFGKLSLASDDESKHRNDMINGSSSEQVQLDVVIVYAFDCSGWTSAWYTVEDAFWIVQEKLTHYPGSRLGYIYPMVDGNTYYTSDMKLVDPRETKATGYTSFARRSVACRKNMASGLEEAHKMISNGGYQNNGLILLFSDGLIHTGDFFNGATEFKSQVPVHVFTLDRWG